jgi:hypothetical protein
MKFNDKTRKHHHLRRKHYYNKKFFDDMEIKYFHHYLPQKCSYNNILGGDHITMK